MLLLIFKRLVKTSTKSIRKLRKKIIEKNKNKKVRVKILSNQ